jgi:ergothioneine biosynthesis protein EgtB
MSTKTARNIEQLRDISPDEYLRIRKRTEEICAPLETEDYVPQPVVDVSPPKWHLGHSTWFFETFLLKPYLKDYSEYDPGFNFVFNSYYETIGRRVIRTDRGNLSRPTVGEIYKYRAHVDRYMLKLLKQDTQAFRGIIQIGINHEQQHQELLITDIKYILGHNPLLPAYSDKITENVKTSAKSWIDIPEGLYPIGYRGEGFCFDNELASHDVFLHAYTISGTTVRNREYMEFMADGGYQDFRHWHADGWEWVNREKVTAPLYWHLIDGQWMNYTLAGLAPVEPDQPVCHISFYEAFAFAAWRNMRLATEFEWEVASPHFKTEGRWEWTESAYLPYPGYKKAPGAIGEYNGKFMVNQMVLRGNSFATPEGHSRNTYRNFFQPWLRWQFSGIRVCR